MDDPHRSTDRNDKLDPRSKNESTDIPLEQRVDERTETEEPTATWPNTDKSDWRIALAPQTEMELPTLKKLRRESDEPTFRKSRTERELPCLADERTEMEEASCTKPITLARYMLPMAQ
jgi:hypothetical protein